MLAREVIQQIKLGLKSPDPTVFDAAYELVKTITDDETIDLLTKGTNSTTHWAADDFVAPRWLGGKGANARQRCALAHLFANAKDGSRTAQLRRDVNRLSDSFGRGRPQEWDLAPFTRFENLEEIKLYLGFGEVPELQHFRALTSLALASYGAEKFRLASVASNTLEELSLARVENVGVDLSQTPKLAVLHLDLSGPPLKILGTSIKEVYSTCEVHVEAEGAPSLVSLAAPDVVFTCEVLPNFRTLRCSLFGPLNVALPSLVELDVSGPLQNLEWIGRQPSVQKLSVCGDLLKSIDGSDLPALKSISLKDSALKNLDLTQFGELEEVSLANARDLINLTLGPSVKSLSLTNARGISEFEQITGNGLKSVHFRQVTISLVRKQPIDSLTHVSIENSWILDCAGVSMLPSLQQLTIASEGLRSLSGIEGHPKLRDIRIEQRSKALTNVDAAQALPSLKSLYLTGKVGVNKSTIPSVIHHAIWPRRLVAGSKPPKPSGKPKPKVVKGATGSQVARLKKLLLSRDMDRMNQAVELAASLADESVFEALLGGVTVTSETVPPASRRSEHLLPPGSNLDVVVPNALFDSGPQLRVFRQHAMLALLGAAGNVYGESLRSQIKTLELSGRVSKWKAVPVDVGTLTNYPNLRCLSITEAPQILHLDALLQCKLEALYIQFYRYEHKLDDLPAPIKLKELHLSGAMGENLSLVNFSVTDRVTIDGEVTSLSHTDRPAVNFVGLTELCLLHGAVHLLTAQRVMPKRLVIDRVTASFLQTLAPLEVDSLHIARIIKDAPIPDWVTQKRKESRSRKATPPTG